ncbi:SsgA family sporulation/cell division regulator [Streptomyces sp. NPDC057877]|uniref:SsgA family sporulation/cell division regulator n=1 Tax=Streptomyces sp. NPDC057877 TaxID=3346269 RepID=UPI003682AC40
MPSLPGRSPFPFGDHIVVEFMVKLVLGPEEAVPIPARFVYDLREPFAVCLEFPRPDGGGVTQWVFARELLADGLRRPAGEGDVRFWPPCDRNGGNDLRMLIRGTTGSAILELPQAPLREWLGRTWGAVAPGQESGLVDWDAVLHRLLLP